MQIELIKGKIYLIRLDFSYPYEVKEYKIEKVTDNCVLIRHRCDDKEGFYHKWYDIKPLLKLTVIEEINEREEKLERLCKQDI